MKTKSRKKKSQKYNLVVVAHPDDELIFFGGLILSQRNLPWKVICVTGGNADGRGHERRREFESSLKSLGVKNFSWLDFPDIYEQRLNIEALAQILNKTEVPSAVYTHNPVGEYGHPHHQDVSLATHRVFYNKCPVWSPAYNSYPEKIIRLPQNIFKKKAKIYTEIYRAETTRFINLLPLTWVEGFTQINLKECEAIYGALARGESLQAKQIKNYLEVLNLLIEAYKNKSRTF